MLFESDVILLVKCHIIELASAV